MDDKSDATNNESDANNNESVATNKSHAINESVANFNEIGPTNKYKHGANNKSHATTCCGSGSNEIGAINKFGPPNNYGPYDNKSGVTCCCGCVSIETGTNVVAMVVCVIDILWAIFYFYVQLWGFGIGSIIKVCVSLLVVCGQQVRNPWLFLPCLILGGLDIFGRVLLAVSFLGCATGSFVLFKYDAAFWLILLGQDGCAIMLGCYVVIIVLYVWFYSVICRGFSALRGAESRRYRPHF